MPNDTRATLLGEISNFSTEEVVNLLQKNELSECCDAVIKRQVDGESLLQLSERNLHLWKSDLTESLRRSLCEFVEELNSAPEQYLLDYDELTSSLSANSDVPGDYWDTDFEDEGPSKSTGEDSSYNGDSDECSEMYGNGNSRSQFRTESPIVSHNDVLHSANEDDENDNFYANGAEMNRLVRLPVNATTSKVLGLGAELQKALAERKGRQNKLTLNPKPPLVEKTSEVMERVRNKQPFVHPQKSFRQKNISDNTTSSPDSKQTDGAPRRQHPITTPNPKSKPNFGEQKMQQPNAMPSPDESKPNIGAQRIKYLNTRSSPESKQTTGPLRMPYLITTPSSEFERIIGAQRMQPANSKPSSEPSQKIGGQRMLQSNTTPSPELKENIEVQRMRLPNLTPSSESRQNIGGQRMPQSNTTPSPESKQNIEPQRMRPPNLTPSNESRQNIGGQRMLQFDRAPSPEVNQNIGAQRMQPPNLTPSSGWKRTIGSTSLQPPERDLLPPKPKDVLQAAPALDKQVRALPKPPSISLSIQNLDLAADHSSQQHDDSEDEYKYEPIKERPTGQDQRSVSVTSDHSTLNFGSGPSIRGSNESVYYTPSMSSVEDHQDVYEVISEKDEPEEQDGYEKAIHRGQSASLPRPERARSLQFSSLPKRPPRTFPTTVKQTGRPLPPTPDASKIERPIENWESDGPSYTEQPWFHNIDREEAIALIEGGSSKFSNGPPDGYFLLRPSATYPNQPFTLVLWYKNRTWKLPVRKRPDNKFALGTVRLQEDSFATIEELVNFHKMNVIPLKTGNANAAAGSTRLTETPPK